ncbi:hypothetical protein [uncultured Rothia sp.]|uniref:hypothetical protein n=1 Tax=uncultured Rothia sp. TaxID=316088 RepID=UPI00288C2720|nr:hypothetical protein [uncultured Rothia sp.]
MATINSPLSSAHEPTKEKSFLEKLTSINLFLKKLKMRYVAIINIFSLFIIWLIYSSKSYLKIDLTIQAFLAFTTFSLLSLLITKNIILNEFVLGNIDKISPIPSKQPSSTENSATKQSYIPGAKYLLKLSTIAISLSFILVLFYYKDALNNTGIALQITSSQFIQSKQLWMITPLLFLAALYFIVLPAFLLSSYSKIGTQLFFNGKKNRQYEDWDLSYKLVCILSLLYFCISTFPLRLIFNFFDSEFMNVYLLISISLSFLIGQGSIIHSMWETARLNGALLHKPSRQSVTFTITAIITILISLLTTIQGILPTIGKAIVNPGSSVTRPEGLYSCIFIGNTQNPAPKSFGIIISNNASSIHMLTPSFNETNQIYASFDDINPLSTDMLTETHLTIKTDYYFEKYNPTKHWYNKKTGTCEYLDTRPSISIYSQFSSPKTALNRFSQQR